LILLRLKLILELCPILRIHPPRRRAHSCRALRLRSRRALRLRGRRGHGLLRLWRRSHQRQSATPTARRSTTRHRSPHNLSKGRTGNLPQLRSPDYLGVAADQIRWSGRITIRNREAIRLHQLLPHPTHQRTRNSREIAARRGRNQPELPEEFLNCFVLEL
jgi:hypothetical protein